ncbi:MAG: HyaD/HybD family hydrogenase maturation endopeptidase [Leptospirillum sp.]|jgi:hydrogenase maturation protease
MDNSKRTLILGIGNLLWGDEGFGVRSIWAFEERFQVPEGVTVMDGGTQGLSLTPFIQETDRLLIFDAVDFQEEPGSLVIRRNEEVPAYLHSGKMSLHQTGFQEVLILCDLLGAAPREMALVGVQPLDWDVFGGSLTSLVRDRIPEVLEKGVEILGEWGIFPVPRKEKSVGWIAPGPLHPALFNGRVFPCA